MEPIQKPTSFKHFIFFNKRNKITLYLATAAIIIQFVTFKYLYPFASYIHGDSFSYLKAAEDNLTINTYMIGYSKFLRIFNTFAKPDYLLVAFQYLLIQCSVLFLLFTIYYFYKPGRYMQIILLCLMVFNPLFLHMGNMVSSDGLFLALSCTWFALLLWLIHKPSNKIIVCHAVILCIVFTVRYNALIYPFIASIAFWLSSLPIKKKIAGMGIALLLCGAFVGFTMWRYKVLTGYWQYSPFSGWQLANNAMYAYREVERNDREPVPEKFRALDKRIRKFYDQNYNLMVGEASTVYMWTRSLPLMQYRDSLFKKANDTAAIELKKWASMGPLYKDYGLHIIKKYPFHFLRYFIWPNAKKYYAPPVEFLEVYNSGSKDVTKQAKGWFGYKTTKVSVRMENAKVKVLNFYPFLSGIINMFMLFGLLYYILLKGWQYNPIFYRMILMSGSVWLLNAGFTIFASSAALRFQSFPIILTTLSTLLLIDWMVQLMRKLKQEHNNQVFKKTISPEAIA